MKAIIKVGYEYYLADPTYATEVVRFFSDSQRVTHEGYGKNEIFIPSDEKLDIEVRFVDDDKVRELTLEETTKKEMEALKRSLENHVRLYEEEKKKTKELECINKALCDKEKEEQKSDS